jgi:hypothetical protein
VSFQEALRLSVPTITSFQDRHSVSSSHPSPFWFKPHMHRSWLKMAANLQCPSRKPNVYLSFLCCIELEFISLHNHVHPGQTWCIFILSSFFYVSLMLTDLCARWLPILVLLGSPMFASHFFLPSVRICWSPLSCPSRTDMVYPHPLLIIFCVSLICTDLC